MKKQQPYEIRVRENGKNRSIFLFANSKDRAKKRVKGGNILSIKKVSLEKILGIGEHFTLKTFDIDKNMFDIGQKRKEK